MKFGSQTTLQSLAIAENATTPTGQAVGAQVWSTITNAIMKWNGSKWMSLKRSVVLKMSSADFTPLATGLDYGSMVTVPWEPNATGRTAIAWTVTDILFRVETAGGSTTSVKIQRYTGTGVFSNTGYLNTTALSVTSGVYEASAPTLAVTAVNSGDKFCCEYTVLGTNVAGFSLYVVLTET